MRMAAIEPAMWAASTPFGYAALARGCYGITDGRMPESIEQLRHVLCLAVGPTSVWAEWAA